MLVSPPGEVSMPVVRARPLVPSLNSLSMILIDTADLDLLEAAIQRPKTCAIVCYWACGVLIAREDVESIATSTNL